MVGVPLLPALDHWVVIHLGYACMIGLRFLGGWGILYYCIVHFYACIKSFLKRTLDQIYVQNVNIRLILFTLSEQGFYYLQHCIKYLSPITQSGWLLIMDNLHVKLTFNLAKTNKIFYYS